MLCFAGLTDMGRTWIGSIMRRKREKVSFIVEREADSHALFEWNFLSLSNPFLRSNPAKIWLTTSQPLDSPLPSLFINLPHKILFGCCFCEEMIGRFAILLKQKYHWEACRLYR